VENLNFKRIPEHSDIKSNKVIIIFYFELFFNYYTLKLNIIFINLKKKKNVKLSYIKFWEFKIKYERIGCLNKKFW